MSAPGRNRGPSPAPTERDPKPDNATAEAPVEASPSGPEWIGWVLVPAGAMGWKWARVSLPESVMEAHRVGPMQPPDLRSMLVAHIENDLLNDRFVDRRGWTR